jgi:hypothetical protein
MRVGLPPLAVPAATAMPAGWTFLPWPRFINRQRPALEVLLVEHRDSFGRIVLRTHFDEGKTSGASGGAVLHNVDRRYRAGLAEVILKVVFGCGEGEVPNE